MQPHRYIQLISALLMLTSLPGASRATDLPIPVPSLETEKLPISGNTVVSAAPEYSGPAESVQVPDQQQAVPPAAYPDPIQDVQPVDTAASPHPNQDSRSGSRTWKVKRGDTLERIARGFSINVRVLVELNRLADPNRINIGDILVIPAGADTWTVRRGEKLELISRALGIPMKTLVSTNGIKDANYIRTGMVLRLPCASTANGVAQTIMVR